MPKNYDIQKLMLRLHRIRGQIDGIERALADNQNSAKILQTAAAARGALNGFIGEVVIAEIDNVIDSNTAATARRTTRDALIDIVHAYLK